MDADRHKKQKLKGNQKNAEQEGFTEDLNLSSDYNPFINQNKVSAEYNELFSSTADNPHDFSIQYEQNKGVGDGGEHIYVADDAGEETTDEATEEVVKSGNYLKQQFNKANLKRVDRRIR